MTEDYGAAGRPFARPESSLPGGRGRVMGFDVLVQSIDALNTSMRQLHQDLVTSMQSQGHFAVGTEGQNYRDAAQTMAGDGQVRVQNLRGQSQRYDPAAGGTNAWSLSAVRQLTWQAFTQRLSSSNQQLQPTAVYQHIGPQASYNPSVGYTQMPGGPQQPPAGPGGGGPQGFQGGGGGMGQQPAGGFPGGGGGHGGGGYGGGGGGGAYGHGGGGYGGGWVNSAIGTLKGTPVVGTIATEVQHTADMYLSEREKNRAYQSVEGTSNAAGFGERFHEEAYRWSLGFGMSGDMARRSFKGATALGYNGVAKGQVQGRQDALDFIYHNYNARGMSPEESLSLLQTSSHDATVSFKDLSTELRNVSKAAGEAGNNAMVFRQTFQQMLGGAIATGAGPGSAQLAGIFTSTQASYGREFAGSDFSNQLGTGYQYMVGAQYGVNPGQLQRTMRQNPQEYARMVSGSQMSFIQGVLNPQQIQELQQLIKQYGSTQAAIDTIEQLFLNSHPEIDLHVLAASLPANLIGVQLDESNVMKWIIQQLAGNTAAAYAGQTKTHAPVAASGTTKSGGYKGGNAQTGKMGLLVPPKSSSFTGNRAVEDELSRIHGGTAWWSLGAVQNENKAGKAYVDQMKKSGQRDPVLEALLQNVDDPNSVQVKVATSSGDRVMSFADAMKYFPNELAAGKATFVSGKEKGKTTADLLGGGNIDASRDYKSELTNPQGAKAGVSAQEYAKKHPSKDTGPGPQKVTVDLTTEAKRLLYLLPSTNNESQATGLPPYNPNSAQGSRGGG